MAISDRPDAAADHEEREWLRLTLSCIGDAVVTADAKGRIKLLNPVAQSLTGWTQKEAHGVPLGRVFNILNEESRQPIENPAFRALREDVVVRLADHTLLLAKDGTEQAIDDTATPIRNAAGEVVGVVLVFRDVTERRRNEKAVQDALAYADNIITTLREPFVVLDKSLRVQKANPAFYRAFSVSELETEKHTLFELGNGQWDIPQLRAMLDEVLSDHQAVEDFEVDHDFPTRGRKVMLLNARRIFSLDRGSDLILLAIEDMTKLSQVAFYSELGHGTAFKLYFPAVDELADDARGQLDVGNVRGTETILLVEDEAGVRVLAYLVLQTRGYKVLAAGDGKDAMRVLAKYQGSIDILVTDVVMPGMGGRDVAEALQPRYPQMKVLYTSGYTDDIVVRHGIVQAESAFLQKPYSPQSLAKKVRQVLEKK